MESEHSPGDIVPSGGVGVLQEVLLTLLITNENPSPTKLSLVFWLGGSVSTFYD